MPAARASSDLVRPASSRSRLMSAPKPSRARRIARSTARSKAAVDIGVDETTARLPVAYRCLVLASARRWPPGPAFREVLHRLCLAVQFATDMEALGLEICSDPGFGVRH